MKVCWLHLICRTPHHSHCQWLPSHSFINESITLHQILLCNKRMTNLHIPNINNKHTLLPRTNPAALFPHGNMQYIKICWCTGSTLCTCSCMHYSMGSLAIIALISFCVHLEIIGSMFFGFNPPCSSNVPSPLSVLINTLVSSNSHFRGRVTTTFYSMRSLNKP